MSPHQKGAPQAGRLAATFSALRDKRVLAMLFLGFSAGMPILLIFSSLSLWLREAGVERGAVTFFSWAALGYSFKFIWAPLIDRIPVPVLTRLLGRRRGWMLVAQLAVICAIVLMALSDPSQGRDALVTMALAAVMLGFSSATQDIVIDAYRIEIAETRMQGVLSAAYIAGYRVGMVVAGAGALYLAARFGSTAEGYSYIAWQLTYLVMAGVMLIGVATTLVVSEPVGQARADNGCGAFDYLRLVLVFLVSAAAFVAAFFVAAASFTAVKQMLGDDALLNFLLETLHFGLAVASALAVGWLLVRFGAVDRSIARATWVEPALDFFSRYGLRTALLLLALVGLYRISDIVLGVIANVFYQDIGFTKPEIATAVKTFGVVVSIAGGFIGGLMATRFGVMRILMLGAVLSAVTNLLFIGLAHIGHSLPMLYVTVSADNLAGGLASAAFVAFLSSLTNVSFTAVQYALFSSLMTLLPKVLGGYSGSMVDGIGYPNFFLFTTLIGVPVLVLVWLAQRSLDVAESPRPPD
ncbi:AmpG family muropeptide MFS transporter [Thiorhodovibrio frisius]|uniref:Major Facilitator Superfamily transporter n=1 Tax=Thiorhodovibrio frisius TaxID=631362 RepID=H8YVL1_9GAMM|nr:MFS transporter [Thiorhodovibrio frisius]EIC23951.1 Major Facilitator Superfamily transporter [Thiorhodovibrio frisius]WPL23024.1 muropeptide transporter [Thiorhodovibrio frisius]